MPRLLLLKLGAIGDVIMTLPAAQAMRAAGYEIDWICGETVAPLLWLYPWINVISVQERSIFEGDLSARMAATLRLWRRLAGRRYDLAATLYYDRRYRLLTLPVRARRRLTLAHGDRGRELLPGRSQTSEYGRILLAQAGTRGSPANPLLRDSESPAQLAPAALPAMPATPYTRASQRRRVVLVPAGARNLMRDSALRRWPIERYRELSEHLLDTGSEVVLIGGPDDAWASPHFAKLAVLDLVGKLTLLESIAILDSADLVITHDTGPLHMAGLTRTPVVAIFGPTSPFTFCPQRDNIIALWGGEGFACRPCYDGREFAPCAHNGCLHQVSVGMVLEAAEALRSAAREGRSLPQMVRLPPHMPLIPASSLGAAHL